jgi:hypothetical protein
MGEDKEKHAEYLKAALSVYSIPKEEVFAWRYDEVTGSTVIVTNGGKKIIHKDGDAAKCKLTFTEITGCLPECEEGRGKKLNRGNMVVKTRCEWRSLWRKIKKSIRIF